MRTARDTEDLDPRPTERAASDCRTFPHPSDNPAPPRHGARAPDHIASSELEAYLAAQRGAVLVHAAAEWSAPSRAMRPQFLKAARSLQWIVRVAMLQVDDARAAAKLGVSAVPALVLFHDGHAVGRCTGAINAKNIIDWTRQGLATVSSRG